MQQTQYIHVGLLAHTTIDFQLEGQFWLCKKSKLTIEPGNYRISIINKQLQLLGENLSFFSGHEMALEPVGKNPTFVIKGVTIGINFHWQQKEDQKFGGSLKFMMAQDTIQAVNIVDVEDYLQSVISSEMSPKASLEFLKAHAVISRSWVLSQINKQNKTQKEEVQQHTPETIIEKWYDHEDHQLFDVCADDHCQRYQGKSKIISKKAIKAVEATKGEVLMYKGNICDARFSKCCGGATENFENVWEDIYHPYLSKIVDSEVGGSSCVDLRVEKEADHWIRNKPQAFCNTSDPKILSQVLPDFDQKTTDFFRWEVTYPQKELASLLKKKSTIDFGEIISLEAVKRGHSARIIHLKVTGTKQTMVFGKELEIRKWLSESHLYSSAFVVDHLNPINGIPSEFKLIGAGWGHGVGLCQIGAAVMGEKGFSYKQILNHYYNRAEIKKAF